MKEGIQRADHESSNGVLMGVRYDKEKQPVRKRCRVGEKFRDSIINHEEEEGMRTLNRA